MAQTAFQKALAAASAKNKEREADMEQDELEIVVPIVSAIVAEASKAFADAKEAVQELGLKLPLMGDLSSAINVFEQNVGIKLKVASERLQEIQQAETEESEEDE